MKLMTVAIFGIGYVLGAKAGRERYGRSAGWHITRRKASMPLPPGNGLRLWPPSLMATLPKHSPSAHTERRHSCPDQVASSPLRQAPRSGRRLRPDLSGCGDAPGITRSRATWSSAR